MKLQSQNNFTKRGFSLVELSVVLIVIAILIAGIVKGQSMIKSAKISNARSLTSRSNVGDISGLIAWYETSLKDSFDNDESFDGAQISNWYDISPSSNLGATKRNTLDKTASSAVTYESDGINSLPSVRFSGSGSIDLANFYQGRLAQRSVFIVLKPITTPSATQQVLFDSDSTGNSFIAIHDDSVRLNAGSAVTTGTVTNPAAFSTTNSYVLAVDFKDDSSSVYLNDATTVIGNSTLDPGSNEVIGLTIGENRSGTNGFGGLISEVIIFNRTLKTQERKDIMKYLSNKYNIGVSNL